jgi:hypothetical protein
MNSSPAIAAPDLEPLRADPEEPRYLCHDEALRREVLPQIATRMAHLCDGSRTVEEVCEEAAISRTRGLAVIDRLRALGVIRSATPPTAEAAFSAMEEAFFAAELPPIDECDESFHSWRERARRRLTRALRRLR